MVGGGLRGGGDGVNRGEWGSIEGVYGRSMQWTREEVLRGG